MMIATCLGNDALASGLRWAGALIHLECVSNKNRLFSARADRCDRHLCAGQFADGLQIRAGFGGQIFPFASLIGRSFLAGEFGIYRQATRQDLDTAWNMTVSSAANAIADANLDSLEADQAVN